MDANITIVTTPSKAVKAARQAAHRLDHDLTVFRLTYQRCTADGTLEPDKHVAFCKVCDMEVVITPLAIPHRVSITGLAVAAHCAPPVLPPAKALRRTDLGRLETASMIWSLVERNADGTPRRYRVGTLRRWKRDPQRFDLPIHYGYRNGNWYHLTCDEDLAPFTLDSPDTHAFPPAHVLDNRRWYQY